MANTIKIKRGTEAGRLGYTPLDGELIYTTDTKELFIGDGVTAGGKSVSLGSDGTDHNHNTIYYTMSNIDSMLGDYVLQSEIGAANGVASLGSDSKIPSSQLPALAITSVNVVTSELEQLALVVEEGDVAIRTDISVTYINNGGVVGDMTDWNEISASNSVDTVNGQTGTVVLNSDNITEGATNLYYTSARAIATIGGSINDAGTTVTDLWSANKITSELSGKLGVNDIIDGGSF